MDRGESMEACKLLCRGACLGEVSFDVQNGCTEIRASMTDPGDGLYRAFLLGPRGERLLGVLEPVEEQKLVLCRRRYTRDIAALGRPLHGEARRSFLFQPSDGWRETARPGTLFESAFLRERLGRVPRAWWKREEETLRLAIPLERGRPFPLEPLFCLAKIQRVEGRLCAVYAFQGECPILS